MSEPYPTVQPRLSLRDLRAAAVARNAARAQTARREAETRIDWVRLANMRTQHDALRASYSDRTAKARLQVAEVARLRTEALEGVAAGREAFLDQSHTALLSTSPEVIAQAGFDARAVRRLAAAMHAVATLRTECDALATRIKASTALITNLNAFARKFE